MLKCERIQVSGLSNALYGMRLPKKSNNKSDSVSLVYDNESGELRSKSINNITSDDIVIKTMIGDEDRGLANMLVLAGSDHGKWLRQIQVSMLITGPMTFWFEFDTYKVATVKNSSSRMHTITRGELTTDDMSWDDESGNLVLTEFREVQLKHLNELIRTYNECTDTEQQKLIFRELIQDLPDSYNFSAIWTGSAQTCRNFYFARRFHKQKEMRDLAIAFSQLPEIDEFIRIVNNAPATPSDNCNNNV